MKLTLTEKIQKEFDHYFSLKLTKDEKRSFELLYWWKVKGMVVSTTDKRVLLPPLPIMTRAARAVLCISLFVDSVRAPPMS
ncbi:hypothetical protein CBR_g17019 [Chara braunii]|uniref:Uncharacterized protein n=1 Tax=Chara braunii TaxID=69332 RepID=A0A388KUE6_CHABU|nr:hypothetical protein CBR_g17019 [Chara braunii]|eukprot:GBG73677.1 hypothetical protein CBR_g17019 [Chara braunii]